MTALETQSSRGLFKSSGGDNPGLRQRRDKEAMVSEYSNVTDGLTAISRLLTETVERSKLTVGNLEDPTQQPPVLEGVKIPVSNRPPHNHYYKGCEKFYK